MKLFLLFPLLFFAFHLHGQQVVFDDGKYKILTENHLVLLAALSEGTASAKEIETAREEIAAKTTLLHALQERVYNSLQEVPPLIAQGLLLKKCAETAKSLSELQQEILQVAGSDPRLLAVAIGQQEAIIERSISLAFRLQEGVLQGGETNLISNAQRLELLRYVLEELRATRGISGQVLRRMKLAARKGWQAPSLLTIPGSDTERVAQILGEF